MVTSVKWEWFKSQEKGATATSRRITRDVRC